MCDPLRPPGRPGPAWHTPAPGESDPDCKTRNSDPPPAGSRLPSRIPSARIPSGRCPRILSERHKRSMKMLSQQRPRPSMLMRTPAASTRCVNSLLVNCDPWSVLKISGRPWVRASSSASRQKAASRVVGQTPGEHVAGEPIHDRHQVNETATQRQVGDVTCPYEVGPIDHPPAQQIGVDSVRGVGGRQASAHRDRLQTQNLHEPVYAFVIDQRSPPDATPARGDARRRKDSGCRGDPERA